MSLYDKDISDVFKICHKNIQMVNIFSNDLNEYVTRKKIPITSKNDVVFLPLIPHVLNNKIIYDSLKDDESKSEYGYNFQAFNFKDKKISEKRNEFIYFQSIMLYSIGEEQRNKNINLIEETLYDNVRFLLNVCDNIAIVKEHEYPYIIKNQNIFINNYLNIINKKEYFEGEKNNEYNKQILSSINALDDVVDKATNKYNIDYRIYKNKVDFSRFLY